MQTSQKSLRIDRWLYYARFYKTRTLATQAVSGGHVERNSEKASPGQKVIAGDVLEIVKNRLPYRITVLDLPARRGPAAEARACYEEDEAVVKIRSELSSELRRDRLQMPTTAGRPDKHTRRLLRQRNRTDT